MNLNRIYQLLAEIFRKLIEPTSNISDPIQRQHIRLLNSILFVFIPVTILGGLTHFIIEPSNVPLIHNRSIINVTVPCTLFLLAAICGRYVGYTAAILLVFASVYATIMINVLFNQADYFNFAYLILLTTLATLLFDIKGVVFIAVIELVSIMMVAAISSQAILLDLAIFLLVGNLILIYIGNYRNRLEADRSQKLEESETFLRLITDQLPVSVWITDEKLKRRATFGRVQGLEQLNTIPTNTAIKAYYQALSGTSIQFEDNRNDRDLQYHVEPMRDAEGKIIGTLGVATDITLQKTAQQQSLQLELEHERVEMLSKFIEHSSHDLRTPLSNINTYLYLLDKAVKSDKEHGYVKVIREQSDRLQELIDNMLTLQRLEFETDYQLTKVSLKSVLDEIDTAYRERIETNQTAFEYVSNQNDILLNVNKQHLHMALAKIIDNAIQFTSAGDTIRLFTSCTKQSTTISIQDTGIGIKEEQIPHIFELFYRGDDSRPASSGDNGLGLAIADRIIKSHHGSISVDSMVGEGSTFHITLPIAGYSINSPQMKPSMA